MFALPFQQVDVFSPVPFRGNPVAVVLDAADLSTAEMQAIAAWTQLSETTFVLPPSRPGADYRVRIFTPRQELPFAGHPSLGTAHALLDVGRLPAERGRWVQECGAGPLPLRAEGSGAARVLWIQAPEAEVGEADLMLTHSLGRALGLALRSEPAPRPVRVGPSWWVVELEDEAAVRSLSPDAARLAVLGAEHGVIGVTVFATSREPGFDYVVRAFAPGDGILEDPVTGSANAAIAAYLYASGRTSGGRRHRISQGREVGREGVVHVHLESSGAIWIGGHCQSVIRGAISRP